LRVVLDMCILKLATFPAENNASTLIFELARAGLIEAWVSPAILVDHAEIVESSPSRSAIRQNSIVGRVPPGAALRAGAGVVAKRVDRPG
jgi:hypothetical protein